MNRAARKILAATIPIVLTAAQTGGCGSSSGSSSAQQGAPAPPNPAVDLCKVATSFPTAGKPARGLVGGISKVTCSDTPDFLDFEVWLYWNPTPSQGADTEVMEDDCNQDEAPSACTVAASCKSGWWSIQWSIEVDYNGAQATDQDHDTYHTTVTPSQCRATR